MVSLTPMPEKKSRSRTKKDKDEGSGSGPDSRSNSATNIRNDTAGAPSLPSSHFSVQHQDKHRSLSWRIQALKCRSNGLAGASSDPDSGKGGKMTWAQVKDAVTTSLGVAGSHTTMVQVHPPSCPSCFTGAGSSPAYQPAR